MTAKSGRRTVFSNPPNEREMASASSLSNILQKKAAVQVRLPIRMVFSPLKLCSADKCTQDKPFVLMSVAEGEGTLNGTRLKKGDHLILPDGYGKVELQGKMQIIASTI